MNEIFSKLDLLAFGAHPDDVEMSAGGTIAQCVHQGKKVGIIDLTRGELGTRGTPEQRQQEAQTAQEILGACIRKNLQLKDGNIQNDEATRRTVIQVIRKYQPNIVLCNAPYDRHPDHGITAALIKDAFFLAGLPKFITTIDGQSQTAWRPFSLFHYIQDMDMKADFFVDISAFWKTKKKAIAAFVSQFHSEDYDTNRMEQETYISSASFMEAFDARYRYYGKQIGVQYAEPFLSVKPLGISDLDFLIHATY